MTAPRTDPHDGWTPQPQEQVQPGDPWRDPDDGDPEYQDAAYSAGRPEERMPTAPRTDPQSTVPVEPLTDAIAYAIARAPVPAHTDTAHDVAARLAPLVIESGYLDAARASRPITATADSGEPIELAELLREFRLRSSLEHNKSEASRLVWATAYDMLAALPVREDEPTGIDGLREAYAAYARSADGAGSVQSPVVQRLVEAVYDRLTREASHVR